MIKISLEESLIKIAVRHSKERMQYEYDRFNLHDDARFDMILIGTIGQLAFKQYLDSRGIEYNFELQAGEFDNFDFEINTEIFEIKTSGYKKEFNGLNMLYNYEQYKRGITKGYKYCVQIFINGYDRENKKFDYDKCDNATIAGIIEFNKIKEYRCRNMGHAKCYIIPLNALLSVEEILNDRNK